MSAEMLAAVARVAGADCVFPIGVADEATIAAFVDLGVPVNVLLRPADLARNRS